MALSAIILRQSSEYPNIELKEYWHFRRRIFETIWILIPFVIGSFFGYHWYIVICVDLLLSPFTEFRVVAIGYMLIILCISSNLMRKARLESLLREESYANETIYSDN